MSVCTPCASDSVGDNCPQISHNIANGSINAVYYQSIELIQQLKSIRMP